MRNLTADSFPSWAHHLFAVPYLLAVIAAVVINGMAVYVFIKRKLLRTSTNIFVMCLCMTDLLMAAMAGPLVVVSSFAQTWLFHSGGCSYYGFIVCIMSYTNIGIVTAISVDRYIVTVKDSKVSISAAWWVVIGSGVHAFVWSIAPILGWSSYTLEGLHTSCSINWQSKSPSDVSIAIALLVEMWFVPLVIITVCYLKILNRFRRHKNTVQRMNHRRRPSEIERDLAKTTLIIIGAFVLAWTPYSIVCAWAAIGDPSQMHPVLVTLPHLSVKFSMVYNPIIYLNRNRHFQKSFFQEFPFFNKIKCLKSKIDPITSNQNTFEMRGSAVLEPRAPTIAGDTSFSIFNQGSLTRTEPGKLFQKRNIQETIQESSEYSGKDLPEISERNEPKPSTSKEKTMQPKLRENSSETS